MVEELCVALREEFRYSLVGRLEVVCVCAYVCESWCVSSLGGSIGCAPVYAKLGGSRPLQRARVCVCIVSKYKAIIW